MKGYNVINDGRNLSNQPIKNDLKQMIKKERLPLQLVMEIITQLAV